ncbi:hypothetical protein QJS66_09740 [Kocuria rhizophila]|nr:hypothetical protein QJS66_09740 [Kocuria rhizophila]
MALPPAAGSTLVGGRCWAPRRPTCSRPPTNAPGPRRSPRPRRRRLEEPAGVCQHAQGEGHRVHTPSTPSATAPSGRKIAVIVGCLLIAFIADRHGVRRAWERFGSLFGFEGWSSRACSASSSHRSPGPSACRGRNAAAGGNFIGQKTILNGSGLHVLRPGHPGPAAPVGADHHGRLAGFANLSSIAIQIGSLRTRAGPPRGRGPAGHVRPLRRLPHQHAQRRARRRDHGLRPAPSPGRSVARGS